MMIENSAGFDFNLENEMGLNAFHRDVVVDDDDILGFHDSVDNASSMRDDDDGDDLMTSMRREGLVTSPTISDSSHCISSSSLDDDIDAALLGSPFGSEELVHGSDDEQQMVSIMHHMYDNDSQKIVESTGAFDALSFPIGSSESNLHSLVAAQQKQENPFANSFLTGFDTKQDQTPSTKHLQTLDVNLMHSLVNGSITNEPTASLENITSNGKKKTSTRAKNGVLKEIANEANKAAATKKRIKMSDSTEELTELEKDPKMDDSEKRRQRRLIKNRESAQASRERKKMYVQNLEQSVTDLTTRNEMLENKMAELERENDFLKEKMRRMERGEATGDMIALNRSPKRHRSNSDQHNSSSSQQHLHKAPSMPDMNNMIGKATSGLSSIMNPFNPSFWTLMMGFQQKQKQQQQQHSENGQVAAASLAGRNVVMFIVLFCVAFMIVYPNVDNTTMPFDASAMSQEEMSQSINTASSTSTTSTDGTTATESSAPAAKRYIGRSILTARPDESTIRVKFQANTCANLAMSDEQRSLIQEQFNKNMVIMSQQWMQNFTGFSREEMKMEEDSVSFEFDREKDELTITMDQPQETISTTKRNKRAKKGKNTDMTFSRKLFRSICDMVDDIEASAS